MNNLEIRTAIMAAGLKHYQVAEKLGIHDDSFSRMLRKELTDEKKRIVLEAIEALKQNDR